MSITADTRRRPAGQPEGGQFAPRSNSSPLGALGPVRPRTIARASAGDVQIVYEVDESADRLRIVVLIRDPELSAREGANAWVEEGAVLTKTPADSDLNRIGAVIASQVSRLAREIDDADDGHEPVDMFLAEFADRRDPFIARGTRRRHGEELEDAPWPDLDITG